MYLQNNSSMASAAAATAEGGIRMQYQELIVSK
jgi:hypothetical protein